MIRFEALETVLDALEREGTLRHAVVRVGVGDEVLTEAYRSPDGKLDDRTLFDMASVTKIFAVTAVTLQAFENGKLAPDTRVAEFFPVPPDKETLTIRHLLTHTLGIGHRSLNRPEITYENVAAAILSLPCDAPVGTRVLYSCPGFILLGKILERVYGRRLDALFRELVAEPLGMTGSGYLPLPGVFPAVNSGRSPADLYQVNDYNCRHLGGIAGNAGLFSNLHDAGLFVRMLLRDGEPLFSRETLDAAARNHTPWGEESRGLGFLYVDSRYTQTGGLFPPGSIGHCGHTGQSFFVDRASGLYVILLTDATITQTLRDGKEHYARVMQMRAEVHDAIKRDLAGR